MEKGVVANDYECRSFLPHLPERTLAARRTVRAAGAPDIGRELWYTCTHVAASREVLLGKRTYRNPRLQSLENSLLDVIDFLGIVH